MKVTKKEEKIVAKIETYNLKDKLQIDDSIDLHIINCMELERFFVNSEDASKVLKIGKELSKPIKRLLKNS